MDFISLELGGIIAAITTIVSFCGWLYKKIYLPWKRIFDSHDNLLENIDTIKQEVTPNGGASIKDCINRIETRQLIIDERSKAVFFNYNEPIFEVDNNGNIMWANSMFHKLMGNKNLQGMDWVNIIDEPLRKEFLDEIKSCGSTGRELSVKTRSIKDKNITFNGFPYRCVKDSQNYGFLIYLTVEK